MDYSQAQILTEEEIDAYYDNLVRVNREKKVILEHKRNMRQDRRRLIKIVGILLVVTLLVSIFVKLSTEITTRLHTISTLEAEVDRLHLVNEDADRRIRDKANVRDIEQVAHGLGMTYPTQDMIVYYDVDERDYMVVCAN